LRIDQSDLYVGGRLVDPLEAARRQMDLVSRINALLDDMPNPELAYYGIAHIPLLFLAGYHLSNKHVLHFFEFNRKTGCWDQLQIEEEEPALEVEGGPLELNYAKGDIVMRISVSYEVMLDDVVGIVPSPIASLHLKVKEPRIDDVKSLRQIKNYSTLFRATLDEIHSKLPNGQRIHIFYSGPVALAVNLGRQISKTIHPRIVVYNYFAKDVPKYSWGLEITGNINSSDFLVRPNSPEGA
jgi:hypothetical protein